MAQVRCTLRGLFEISQDPGQAGLAKPATHRLGVNSWSLSRRRQTSARPNASHLLPQYTPPPLCQAEAVKHAQQTHTCEMTQRQNPCWRLQSSVAFKLVLHVNNTSASCCSYTYTSLRPPVGGGCHGGLFGTPVCCATHLAVITVEPKFIQFRLAKTATTLTVKIWGADLFVSGLLVWYFDQSPWTESGEAEAHSGRCSFSHNVPLYWVLILKENKRVTEFANTYWQVK